MPDHLAKTNEQAEAYARRYRTMKTWTLGLSIVTGACGALTAFVQTEVMADRIAVGLWSAVLGLVVTVSAVVTSTSLKPARLATVTKARNLLRGAGIRLASARTTDETKENIAMAVAEKRWDDLEKLIHGTERQLVVPLTPPPDRF